jgi:hypothetical protein
MKKILLSTIVIVSLLACSKQKITPSHISSIITTESVAKINNENLRQDLINYKPIIKFKHTGVSQPGGPPVPPCEKPLGICIIFGFVALPENANITANDRAQGIGTAVMNLIDNNHLKLVPDTKFAYDDGTIVIEGNKLIDDKLSKQLGKRKIEVKQGVYQVNLNEGQFGSVILNVNALN